MKLLWKVMSAMRKRRSTTPVRSGSRSRSRGYASPSASRRKKSRRKQSPVPDSNTSKAQASPPKAVISDESKLQKFITRVVFGLLLVGVLFFFIWAGHVAIISLIIVCQIALFRELSNVRYIEEEGKRVPMFRTLMWLFFFTAMFYANGN